MWIFYYLPIFERVSFFWPRFYQKPHSWPAAAIPLQCCLGSIRQFSSNLQPTLPQFCSPLKYKDAFEILECRVRTNYCLLKEIVAALLSKHPHFPSYSGAPLGRVLQVQLYPSIFRKPHLHPSILQKPLGPFLTGLWSWGNDLHPSFESHYGAPELTMAKLWPRLL